MVPKIKRAPDKSPYFLNVDLEIIAHNPLDALIREMGRRVVVLFYGPIAGRRVLVLETARTHKNPDSAIGALCAMVEQFTPGTRRIWRAARKHFDVGYELRSTERFSRFTLRPETLRRAASLGSFLMVTYYRGVEREP
jgi:hypothetical protein